MKQANTFVEAFRHEHRVVRDLVCALIGAFEERDPAQARALLRQVVAVAGPHFRYEEESLFPLLVDVVGPLCRRTA